MASSGNASAEFVMIPVPKRLVGDVYRLLADAAEKDDSIEAPHARLRGTEVYSADEEKHATRLLQWTPALVRRNWTESPEALKRALRYLADRPDQSIPIDELAQAVYGNGDIPSRRRLAGMLGAFGHRVSSRYHVSTWPIAVTNDHDLGMYVYVMPAVFAELHRGL